MNEKQFAALLAQVQGLSTDIKSLTEKIKELQTESEELKGLDIKKTVEEFEKLKASHERVVEAVRRNRRGGYVSGLEDEGRNFSLIRAMLAVQSGNWKGAEFEKEVLDQYREKMLSLKASHVVGDDELGGFFVPDQIIPDIIGAIYTRSQFISLDGDDGTTRVTLLDNLIGGNVKIPKFEGGLIAYWIGEEDDYVESVTKVGDIKLTPKKLGVLIRLTQEMRNMAGYGFENLIRNDMIRAASKKIDHAIPFGRGGDNMPLGIFNTNGIKIYSAQSGKFGVLGIDALSGAQYQADWDGAEIDYDDLDEMKLVLEEDDIVEDGTTWWMSSPRMWSRMKRLRMSHGNATPDAADIKPYLLGAPMLTDQRLADLIGPFFKQNQFATTNEPGETIGAPISGVASALHGDLAYGNLGEVIFGRWSGIQIEDDSGRGKGFISDHIYVKLRLWCDVQVRQPRAIILCPDARARD